MSTEPEAINPPMYYCGCYGGKGHMTWTPQLRTVWRGDTELPWELDDPVRFGKTDARGSSVLTHLDGWTVLRLHDRTIDTRPGSHSTFAAKGTLTDEEIRALAAIRFPTVVARLERAVASQEAPQ